MADRVVNNIRNNEFEVYFTKIPQTGLKSQNKFLITPELDFINMTIKNCNFPAIRVGDIKIPYQGHLDTILPGGSFNIDPIEMVFSLDSNANNYKALLNWTLIQNDVIFGGAQNRNFKLKECIGEIVFKFLNTSISSVMTVKFELQIASLPSLPFTPNTPVPTVVDFGVGFTVVNMKNLYDVQQGES